MDASGLVTAAGNGTATITATAGRAAVSATVTVEQEAVTLTLTPEDVAFRALGDTLRLVAEAADANGHPVPVAWSSSDTAVAQVDDFGAGHGGGQRNRDDHRDGGPGGGERDRDRGTGGSRR